MLVIDLIGNTYYVTSQQRMFLLMTALITFALTSLDHAPKK